MEEKPLYAAYSCDSPGRDLFLRSAMRVLLILFLLLLVQSGLLALVLAVASGGRVGDLFFEPGYVSGNLNPSHR